MVARAAVEMVAEVAEAREEVVTGVAARARAAEAMEEAATGVVARETVAAVMVAAVKVVVVTGVAARVTVAAATVPSLRPFLSCTAKLIPQHGGATGQGRVGLIYVRRAFDPRASGSRHDRAGG
mgnify:CR=1 FL=1